MINSLSNLLLASIIPTIPQARLYLNSVFALQLQLKALIANSVLIWL